MHAGSVSPAPTGSEQAQAVECHAWWSRVACHHHSALSAGAPAYWAEPRIYGYPIVFMLVPDLSLKLYYSNLSQADQRYSY